MPKRARGTSKGTPNSEARRQAQPADRAEPANPDEAGLEVSAVTTMVCITCGAEQFFTSVSDIPASLVCERCRSTVFRSFTTPVTGDEAASSALEEQARNVSFGDPSPDTTQGELNEL